MLNKLLIVLANKLDRAGQYTTADEVDGLIQIAGHSDEEIDSSVEKYFSDPNIQERNSVEREYGLDEDDMLGLNPGSWNDFKWSYEGFPRGHEGAKEFERYQTGISNTDAAAPDMIKDTDGNGLWELQDIFDAPEGASNGKYQAVYKFIPNTEMSKRKERLDISSILGDAETETLEIPEDVIEVKEAPQENHGGGVNIF